MPKPAEIDVVAVLAIGPSGIWALQQTCTAAERYHRFRFTGGLGARGRAGSA